MIPVAGDAINAGMNYILVVKKAEEAEYDYFVDFIAKRSFDLEIGSPVGLSAVW